MKINKKYLIFPVNSKCTGKKLNFTENGKVIYSLDINYTDETPDFYAYIDVSRFLGREIEPSLKPIKEAESYPEDIYKEDGRPQIHFTVKSGWNNDPNGLLYLNGKYHMFYQYNPAGKTWGNMHWGHAESTDLIFWEEKDVALFPDEMGMMYSGSALIDRENKLGFGENTPIFYYTAASKNSVQCLAYSLNGGESLIKYLGNPIVPTIKGENRDPKVVFCPEIQAYVMALFVDEPNHFAFLKSENLSDWEIFQNIDFEGDRECPDFFPLYTDKGEKYWVFICAHDKYVLGKIENGQFVFGETKNMSAPSSVAYAGQTFQGIEGRTVRIVWNAAWQGGLKCSRASQQMGFPTELFLEKVGETVYLSARPIREIEKLFKNSFRKQNFVLTDHCQKLESGAVYLKLDAEMKEEGSLKITIFGNDISLDFKKNKLSVGSSSDKISLSGDKVSLEIIVDTGSIEVFSDGGKICFANYVYADYEKPYVSLKSEELKTNNLEIHDLKNIWEETK